MSRKLSHEEMFKKVGNILHFDDNPYHIIHDCLIVYKPVSMRSITPLSKLFSKTAVMAIPSQANARATIIMGEEADTKLMREDVRFKALCKEAWRQHIHERTGLDGYENLPENIRNWFETGHVGSSSLTLLNVSLGRKYGFYESDDHTDDSPLDSQDFERCALLVKAVPELKDHLPKMAGISPLWKFAVEKVHYSVEVYRGAEMIVSAGTDTTMNQSSPIALVADSVDVNGGVHKNGFTMNIKPFYINDQLMTAFDFNATDMASVSGYKNILKSNCGEIVHAPIWSSNTQNQYMVKITPYIL